MADNEIQQYWKYDPGAGWVHHQVQDVTDILERNKELAKQPNPKGDRFWHKWSLPNTVVDQLYHRYSAGGVAKPMNDEFWKWVDGIVMSDPDYLHFRTGNKSNPFFVGYNK